MLVIKKSYSKIMTKFIQNCSFFIFMKINWLKNFLEKIFYDFYIL